MACCHQSGQRFINSHSPRISGVFFLIKYTGVPAAPSMAHRGRVAVPAATEIRQHPGASDGHLLNLDSYRSTGTLWPGPFVKMRTGSALPGTLCHPNGSECMAGSCNGQTEPPGCDPVGPLPPSTPCGNTCTDHCDGQGNCVLVDASLRWCPEGMQCGNKDCATTKYERCRLLELQEPERFWYFCQCIQPTPDQCVCAAPQK